MTNISSTVAGQGTCLKDLKHFTGDTKTAAARCNAAHQQAVWKLTCNWFEVLKNCIKINIILFTIYLPFYIRKYVHIYYFAAPEPQEPEPQEQQVPQVEILEAPGETTSTSCFIYCSHWKHLGDLDDINICCSNYLTLFLWFQRLCLPWTSVSFLKKKGIVGNLSWSGTTTPPARTASASGTEAAAGTRTASTLMSSVWRPVENQVLLDFLVLVNRYR